MKNKNLKKAIKKLEKLQIQLVKIKEIESMNLFGELKQTNVIPEKRLSSIIAELKKYDDEV